MDRDVAGGGLGCPGDQSALGRAHERRTDVMSAIGPKQTFGSAPHASAFDVHALSQQVDFLLHDIGLDGTGPSCRVRIAKIYQRAAENCRGLSI